MDKTDPPASFGVFKPVGHTVIALQSEARVQAVVSALLAQGFASDALVRYSPQEMVAQVDAQEQAASPLAAFGQELNLIKSHRELAQHGCSFLVVHAPDDEPAERVAEVARAMQAVSAQRYGRFLIEELIERTPGEAQVFESPERGLDVDVPAVAALPAVAVR
jgi:hypothetical protein